MTKLLTFLAVLPSILTLSTLAQASPATSATSGRSAYPMIGSQTYLMDHDVLDEFAGPIDLYRSKETLATHEIVFNILRHQLICVATEQVCVSHDAHGHCTGYENECVQWEDRTIPIQKTVELNFTDLPALQKDQEEVYQLTLTRTVPAGDGEDMLMTDFQAGTTIQPVKVLRWSDYRYDVSLKTPQ